MTLLLFQMMEKPMVVMAAQPAPRVVAIRTAAIRTKQTATRPRQTAARLTIAPVAPQAMAPQMAVAARPARMMARMAARGLTALEQLEPTAPVDQLVLQTVRKRVMARAAPTLHPVLIPVMVALPHLEATPRVALTSHPPPAPHPVPAQEQAACPMHPA